MAQGAVQFSLYDQNHRFLVCIGHTLALLGLFVVCHPMAALGQERIPKMQVHTGTDLQASTNLDLQASEKIEQQVFSYHLELLDVQNDSIHPSEAIDSDGADPFEETLPFVHDATPVPSLQSSSTRRELDEHINSIGIEGSRARGLRQIIRNTQNSVMILEGNTKTFEVDLDQRPSSTVTVTVSGQGTAVTVDTDGNTDGEQNTLEFTTENWSTVQTVTVTANQDPDDVDNQVTLTLTASEGAASPSSVVVTIVDDERPRELSPWSIQEGGGASFIVPSIRDVGPPSDDVIFTITGHEGTDLRLDKTELTFPVNFWWISQRIALTTELDFDHVDDQVTLMFTAEGGGYSGLKYTVDVTIVDRPPAEVLILEGDTVELRFSLKGGNSPRTDQIATFDQYEDTDLTVEPRQLIFRASDWHQCTHENVSTICSGTETAKLMAGHDPDAVDDQNIMRLRVTGPLGSDFIGVSRLIYVRVDDDDAPRLVIDPAKLKINEGANGEFSIKLSDPPLGETGENDVTVTIPTSVGDVTSNSTSLKFTASDWNQPKKVRLRAEHDDDIKDDVETLWVTANGGDFDRETRSIKITVIDDDKPGIVVRPNLVEMEEGGTETLEVRFIGQPSGDVRVTMDWPRGTGLDLRPMVLGFTSDNWSEWQQVALTARRDADSENQEVLVTLTAVGGDYTGLTRTILVRIIDNDVPEILALSEVTITEGNRYPFMVRLSETPSGMVEVMFSGHENTDIKLDRTSLTFNNTNWETLQPVTLIAGEDDEDYMDDRINLLITASGGNYDGVTHTAEVTIIDNDEAVMISIYDQQGLEDGGSFQFRVELSRSTDHVVTVQYATSDIDAVEGMDYTASRGIVIFDPGATRGVIEIAITDDEIPEGVEEFEVTLSKPRDAVIARGIGTGTIFEDDGSAVLRVDDAVALEKEGVVRFRVSLSHPQRQMVSAEYRTQDGTAKAGEDYQDSAGLVTLAAGTTEAVIAISLLKDGVDWQDETFTVHLISSKQVQITRGVGVATIQESMTTSERVLEAYAGRFVRTSSVQIVEALGERFRSGSDGAACGAAERAEMARLWVTASDWNPSLGELLAGCRLSKSTPLSGGSFSVWGESAFRRFNGRGEDALTLSGEVTTGMLGADYFWQGGWLAGVLLVHSRGNGSFEVVHKSGETTAGLTGIYPYMSYSRAGWNVWLSAGAGHGQIEVPKLEGDLAARFGAVGVRGNLMSAGSVGFSYHGDLLVTDAEVTEHDVTAEVYRVRAGVEADVRIINGIHPYVEANVRQDGGSAETGIGLELGGGVRMAYPAWHLKGDIRTQGLVVHTADGFMEWGISGSLQVGSGSEGVMVNLRPSWGRSNGMSMYHQHTILDTAPVGVATHRTELEFGYGFPWRDGVVGSVMGLTQLPQGVMYRLGGELRPWDQLTLSVFGLAHARTTAQRDVGMSIQGSLRY